MRQTLYAPLSAAASGRHCFFDPNVRAPSLFWMSSSVFSFIVAYIDKVLSWFTRPSSATKLNFRGQKGHVSELPSCAAFSTVETAARKQMPYFVFLLSFL